MSSGSIMGYFHRPSHKVSSVVAHTMAALKAGYDTDVCEHVGSVPLQTEIQYSTRSIGAYNCRRMRVRVCVLHAKESSGKEARHITHTFLFTRTCDAYMRT